MHGWKGRDFTFAFDHHHHASDTEELCFVHFESVPRAVAVWDLEKEVLFP